VFSSIPTEEEIRLSEINCLKQKHSSKDSSSKRKAADEEVNDSNKKQKQQKDKDKDKEKGGDLSKPIPAHIAPVVPRRTYSSLDKEEAEF
jgi:hypothetical protein